MTPLCTLQTVEEQKAALLWAMLIPYFPGDVKALETSFVRHVEYSLARRRENTDSQVRFRPCINGLVLR